MLEASTELSCQAPMNQAGNSLCMNAVLDWTLFTAMGEAAHDQHNVIVMADRENSHRSASLVCDGCQDL